MQQQPLNPINYIADLSPCFTRSCGPQQNKRYHLWSYIAILMAASLLFAMVPSVGGLMAGRLLHGFGASGLWTVALALLGENVNTQTAGRMTGITQVGFAVGVDRTYSRSSL